jgi:hypothetical protein
VRARVREAAAGAYRSRDHARCVCSPHLRRSSFSLMRAFQRASWLALIAARVRSARACCTAVAACLHRLVVCCTYSKV